MNKEEKQKKRKIREVLKLRKSSGITLVALVVTIIILIILATISINAIFGDQSLIGQANNAKVEYRAATVDEEVLAWKAGQKMVEYGGGTVQSKNALIDDQLKRGLLTQEEAETAKKKSVVQIGSRTINYETVPEKLDDALTGENFFSETASYGEDGNKMEADGEETPKITIPVGFKITEGTDINDGIVIADSQGNEFVWVPCTVEEYEKHNYISDSDDDVNKNVADTTGGWNTWNYRAYTDWKEEADLETNKLSIKKYGGFYIARYEARSAK